MMSSEESNRRISFEAESLEERIMLTNDVGGNISTDTTWADTTADYRLISDLTVDFGATLTILPGVTVRTDGGFNDQNDDLFVEGAISANGVFFE